MNGQCKATSVLWKCGRELSAATKTMEIGTERADSELVDSVADEVDMVTVTGKAVASEERGEKVMNGGLIPEMNLSEEERIESF